jgi:hypothetical protein
MSNISAVGYGGWLYTSQKKCGTHGMWKHYFLNIVIPFIRSVAETHKSRDANGNACGHFLIQDGEDIILKAAMDEVVVAAFNELNVNSCKGEPSHTELTQELDVGTVFRDLKAGVSNNTLTHAKRERYADASLSHQLNEYCNDLKAQFTATSLTGDACKIKG